MNESFDSAILFDKPIVIDDGPAGEPDFITIWGILYNRAERSYEGWYKDMMIEICYLMGSQRLQYNGGDISKTKWYLPSGKVIPISHAMIYFVFKTLSPNIIDFRIIEFDNPINFKKGENDGIYLLSNQPFIRYGLIKNTHNNEDNDEEIK